MAPPQFTIDGKQFDPRRADHVMVVGTAEEWTIRNTSLIPHPFHIHINPFQVVARSDTNGGRPLDKPWIWQDTIALPVAKDGKPGWVRIRHRFEDYTGTFVLHCHILGHEDRGMMQLLQVAQSPEPIPIPPVAFCSIPAGTTPVLAAPAGEPVTS